MIEIERKFLVRKNTWPAPRRSIVMRQGYMAQQGNLVCRVRHKDSQYYLSIKARIDDQSSYDYEYPIPSVDGETMLGKLCSKPPIAKTRHEVACDGLVWEVDEFHDANQGLVVAEVELPRADYPLTVPEWVEHEVTGDKRYTNASLYHSPWSQWPG